MKPLSIDGAWLFTPDKHPDERGVFFENYRAAGFEAVLGYRLDVAQVNCSTSRRGVIRGIHFADVPPGQAKYVSCLRGAILDVIVDLRAGSPTFGEWEMAELDDWNRQSVFLSEGLGHAFMAMSAGSVVSYLCSAAHAPLREHAVNPLDPAIGIRWPDDAAPVLSVKDRTAPSLAEALDAGLLPDYEECVRHEVRLRAGEAR